MWESPSAVLLKDVIRPVGTNGEEAQRRRAASPEVALYELSRNYAVELKCEILAFLASLSRQAFLPYAGPTL